jgi:hypothetical protein
MARIMVIGSIPSLFRLTLIETLLDFLEEVGFGDEEGLVDGCLPHLAFILVVMTSEKPEP